jgi:hypothetical protein
VIVEFIDDNRDEFGVEPICTALRVAPSTYYAAKRRPLSARAVRDAMLIPVLVALWKANYQVYGAHKLWKAATRAGHEIGRDQVARLMRSAGIEGVRRTKRVRTTRPQRRRAAASRSGQAELYGERPEPVVGHRSGAPRSALKPCGGERTPPPVRRSGPAEAEGSLTPGTGEGWTAALTTTGRISTARWSGSG